MPMSDPTLVPCGICGVPTPMTGTRRCDWCFELEGRVRRNPERALQILSTVPGYQLDATLRDQFAMHAPFDVPSWFRHVPTTKVPPQQSYKDALMRVDGADKLAPERFNQIINWLRDPVYDLEDPELARMADEAFAIFNEANRERAAVVVSHEAERWFSWRWYYARKMMAAREES